MNIGKSHYFSAMFILVILLCPIRPASAIELSKEEQAYLHEKSTIVFVSQTRYPPFEFVDKNGEHTGMCIELARWMATELGFTARFVDSSFQEAQKAILSGKADVLTSLFYSKKRDELFGFTQVMFEVPASIFVVEERTDIKDISDLNGKLIAMQSGDYAKEYLESKNISFDVVYTKDFADATDLVIAGKADAVIGDEQIVLYHIFKNRLTKKIKRVGDPLYIGQNCMATKESNQMLINILKKGINLAQKNGIFEKINRKWIGTLYAPRDSLLFTYLPHILVSVGVVFMLLLLIWFWNIRLRHVVRERTGDLEKSEERLKSIFESIPSPIVLYNTEGHPLYLNPAFTELFLWSLDELKGRRIPFVPDDQKDLSARKVGEVYRTGKVVKYETKRLTKQGDVLDVIVSGAFVTGPDGDPVEMVAILTEITGLKQAEEALQESEEKYRLLIENATDAIFIAQDEILKFTNPKAEEMTGYSAEELGKIPFLDLIHPEDRDMVLERHMKRLKGEEIPGIHSFRIFNRSGEELLVELNAVVISWEGRPATLNFLRDITAQQRLEAKLQQAQKMEAIGTLAGGIAHDFNNLLMAIQGRASIMLMNKDSSHPDFGHLRGIEGHVESAADLTKQLLGFARGGKYEVKPTDLNELIKKESRMFGRTKKEITIHGTYEENLWSVEVDRGQIEQVLLNLYVNAWQAMPEGGNLYLETENVTIDESYVKAFSIEPGRYVKISVTDTGVGMDKATRERIFDPFFTTKEMGRGTGLGLASVYGIIKNHGGFINVYSKKGEGAAFNIYLPASEKEVIEEEKLAGGILRGSETVLLVDDEDMIIEVAEELFEQLGYKVLIARSGKEAVEIYEKNKERIDMVILDMIMPDMSGSVTYDMMKEIDPDIKVLLSSGYSINGQAAEILDRGCNGFIQKPFKMKELSQKLREILDEK